MKCFLLKKAGVLLLMMELAVVAIAVCVRRAVIFSQTVFLLRVFRF